MISRQSTFQLHRGWGCMAWSRRRRMGVAVWHWCTSCESIGSEIMAMPVTTAQCTDHCTVCTHVRYNAQLEDCALYKKESGSEMMAAPSLVDIVTRTACCPDHCLLSFILHIFYQGEQITAISPFFSFSSLIL